MKRETRELTTVDVALGTARMTVRFAMTRTPEGDPEDLVISLGYGDGAGFNRPPWNGPPLVIPGEALPRIREALAILDSGDGA